MNDRQRQRRNNWMLARAIYGRYAGAGQNKIQGRKPVKFQQVTKSQVQKATQSKKKVPLRKKVAKIQKQLKADQAYHTYREYGNLRVLSAVATCEHDTVLVHNNSTIETAMANLRYYDPSVPGTLVTANASTGTYSRQVHVRRTTLSVSVRNNYQVPCKYRLYALYARSDTNIAPLTYYTNGLTDQFIVASTETTPGAYLTDVDTLKAQYTVKTLKSGILEPGRQISSTQVLGSYDYDPSLTDSHTVAYQKKYKACAFILRIEGVLGHDTVADQQCLMASGCDVEFMRKYEFIYDAGVNLNDFYVYDNRNSSFTNAGVVSLKPVADNIQYSVS